MKLRIARKVAKRCHDTNASKCPYDEMQMFRAYARVHAEWRKRRNVRIEEDGRKTFSITDDFYREHWLWSMMIRYRYFLPHNLAQRKINPTFRGGDNKDMRRWVERTWKPPQS